MPNSFLIQYKSLIETGTPEEVDCFVNEHAEEMGYEHAAWHVWRFRRFEALNPLRKKLLSKFTNCEPLEWRGLEVLYYLQEHKLTGDLELDRELACPAIFRALCRYLLRSPRGREQALRLQLVGFGLIEEWGDANLPFITDPDATAIYGELSQLERMLMECGRINRGTAEPLAVLSGSQGLLELTRNPDSEHLVEIYLGPYFFVDLDETQKAKASIPATFKSPFREGLRILMQCFLKRGWQVMPWLTWRGGLAPICRGRGKLSFSYHTHGRIPGRFHYKFGHFSNLIQIDPEGYAGFSRLSAATPEEIKRATEQIDDDALSAALSKYHEEYIANRFTWRIQTCSSPPNLQKGHKTIFVPLQDPFDEVASLAFMSPADVLDVVAKNVGQHDLVYVKCHPVDRTKRTQDLLANFRDNPKLVITDAPIHDLFRISDLVVTINSGVGFEALLAGLPVITCGKSDYHLATRTAHTREELRRALHAGDHPCFYWRQRVLLNYFESYIYDPRDAYKFENKIVNKFKL